MKKIIPILVHIFGVFFISQIFYFLLTPVALADTHLNGLIDVDTTLTANNNPYYLDHSVEVVPGVTLSIEPGVYITSTTSGSLFVDNSKIIIKL